MFKYDHTGIQYSNFLGGFNLSVSCLKDSLGAKLKHNGGLVGVGGVSTDLGYLAGSSRDYPRIQQGVLHPLGWVIR